MLPGSFELSGVYNLCKLKRVYGTQKIEEAIRPYLRKKDWALLDCQINFFGDYQTLYGPKEAEKVTQMLEELISEVLEKIGGPEDVLGSDSANHFVMITSEIAAPKVRERLKTRFNTDITNHYSAVDRERGYMVGRNNERVLFMHLSVGIVLSDRSSPS